jgi:hypothetical protein
LPAVGGVRDSVRVAPVPYSEEFVHAARSEADALKLEAERLRAESGRHMALAEAATAQAITLEQRARELDELLGRAPQLRLDLQRDALRGQRLREAAIEILASRRGVGEPIHYRDWFELVVAEGHRVEGKDPLATFLTQVTRSPVVRREEDRRGVYRIDIEAAGARALRELDEARHQLASPTAAPSAERRAAAAERALSEIARLEAALRARAA